MTAADLRPILDVILKLLSIVGGAALLGGFLGFIVATPVLIMIGRRRLLRRSPRTWNLLTTLVYPYLLVVFILTGGGLGGVFAGHRYTERWISGTLAPMVQLKLPTIREWLNKEVDWGHTRAASIDDIAHLILTRLYYKPESDSWFEQKRARMVNYVTLNVGKWIIVGALGAFVGYVVARGGDTVGLDKGTIQITVDLIKEMDLSKVDQSFFQILESAMLGQIDKVFKGFYVQAALFFLLGLLVPLAEILIYFLWYERRVARSATLPANESP
jgi:hypothetical protein